MTSASNHSLPAEKGSVNDMHTGAGILNLSMNYQFIVEEASKSTERNVGVKAFTDL